MFHSNMFERILKPETEEISSETGTLAINLKCLSISKVVIFQYLYPNHPESSRICNCKI